MINKNNSAPRLTSASTCFTPPNDEDEEEDNTPVPFIPNLRDPPTADGHDPDDHDDDDHIPLLAPSPLAAASPAGIFAPSSDAQQRIMDNLHALLARVTAAAEPLGTGSWVMSVACPTSLQSVDDLRSQIRATSCLADRQNDLLFRRFTVSDLGSQENCPRRSILAGLYRRESLLDLRYTSSAKLSQALNRSNWTLTRSMARVTVGLHARRALRKVLSEGFHATRMFLRDIGCEHCLWQAYFPAKCANMSEWMTYVRHYAAHFEMGVNVFNENGWKGLEELLRLRAIVTANSFDNALDAPPGNDEFPSVAFQVAYFLLATPSVKRCTIGKLLNGNGAKINRLLEQVTLHLADLMEFAGLDVGAALRFFTSHFPIGGESQVIYRSMDAFAKAYVSSRLREGARELLDHPNAASDLRLPISALFGPKSECRVERIHERVTPPERTSISPTDTPKSHQTRTILRRLLPSLGGSADGSPSAESSGGSGNAPHYSAFLGRRELPGKRRARLWFRRRRMKTARISPVYASEDAVMDDGLSSATDIIILTKSAREFESDFSDPRAKGYLRCNVGMLQLLEEDLTLFQDATLSIGYAMVMLNTSQHHAALSRKAKISKGTFRQMIGSVDVKVPSELIDQWFGSFSAYPLKERESTLVDFYSNRNRQSSWLWRFPPDAQKTLSDSVDSLIDEALGVVLPATTLIRMSGLKRQHVRYLWADPKTQALVWCGVFGSVNCPPTADAVDMGDQSDMRRSTSRLKHRVTTRFRQVSKEHSSVVLESDDLTPRLRHSRIRTCSNTSQFPRRTDHQRFPTAPPTASLKEQTSPVRPVPAQKPVDLKSLPLRDLRGFSIIPLTRIRSLMGDASTKLLESSKVFSAVQRDGNSRGCLLQVITGPDARSSMEFILPDTMIPEEIEIWLEYLKRVIEANLSSYEASKFTPPIQRPYRLVAQLPNADSWDWAARLLFSSEARCRTKAWVLIHQHLRDVEGPDSFRVLDWLATIIAAIPDLVIPDGLREKHLETNLMRDVYASRVRTNEPSSDIILLEQLALDAVNKFPLLLFPAQALCDASVRTQHWIVHHLTFGQIDLTLTESEIRDIIHGHTPVACRLVDLGLEIQAVPNAMRRRSTVVRSSSPTELTYSPGVRWAVQGFSSVHVCVRLMAALLKRSLVRVPRLTHFFLLGWLSQLLPLHRSSGLIVAAGFLALLELRTDLMDFAGDDGFPAVLADIESRIPLHMRHWREIGFDVEGCIREWHSSAFIYAIPLQGLAQCWGQLFAPAPVGGMPKSQAGSVSGDNRAFVNQTIKLLEVLTLFDSALLLGHEETMALFSKPLRRPLWDIYLAS